MNGEHFVIDFEPIGRRSTVAAGNSVLSAAQDVGVELVSLCGGVGACDSCKVRIASGPVEPPTLVEESVFSEEELAFGWRLACQVEPLGDIKVEIPPESLTTPQRLQLEGELLQSSEYVPHIIPLDLDIKPPDLHDLRSDSQRLADALATAGFARPLITRPVIAAASTLLRQQAWSVRLAVQNTELVAVLPKYTPLLGLAVDIGTTSIAAYLVDLATGDVLSRRGAMNPQITFGEDVISRILYINQHVDGQRILQERVVAEVNALLKSMLEEVDSTKENVVEVVVVGNTAMHHIFAGLPVRQLGEAPYVPSVGDSFVYPARQVGLSTSTGADVYMPPNIAGYVGADHVSMQAAVDLWGASQTVLALDIGTNTEVTLTHAGRSYCCSCASGPAFEGAHIGAGMRAAPGAIERVQWVDSKVLTKTIAGQPAVGICGSGILDTIAVMIEAGVLNERGALKKDHPLVTNGSDGRPAFILVPGEASGNQRPLVISRKDVAEIQLAKGAIRAGIEILLREAAISAEEIDQFIVAGAFGTYIDIKSAIAVGMFPDLPLDRFRQVGNAAGMGAVLLLLSRESRRRAELAVQDIEYVELTTYSGFQDDFVRYMTFDRIGEG